MRGDVMTMSIFEVRVLGSLGPAARKAFAPFAVDAEPASTVISGEFTQAQLHELLERVRAFALELIDIRQLPGQKSVAKDEPRRCVRCDAHSGPIQMNRGSDVGTDHHRL
jgi:hypothetical protein